MIEDKTILAVVPARGGSKGVHRKNLRELAGKSLLARSIEIARRVDLIDRLVVDTDDGEIAVAARNAGAEVPSLRPAELATDTASVIDCLIHLLDRIGTSYHYVLLLQCTSPLRTSKDIENAIRLCSSAGTPACVSVSVTEKPPQWLVRLDAAGRISPLLGWDGFYQRRQDLEVAYLPNGAVFLAEVGWFREHRTFYSPATLAYLMPPERAHDIDTEDDLRLVELKLRQCPLAET
jgi:N-acylneuraminate cytidylyltransferase